MSTIDPVTLAILKGRLEQIADEMDATLYRSAFNPIIAEARDASHGLYHAETGETLVQGKAGLPIFVGAMSFAVQAVIRRVRNGTPLDPGDTFIFNDPYCPENTGDYRWSTADGRLLLETVDDPCAFDLRAENLTGQSWQACSSPGSTPGTRSHERRTTRHPDLRRWPSPPAPWWSATPAPRSGAPTRGT